MSNILINSSRVSVNTGTLGFSSSKALQPGINITSYTDTSVNYILINPYGSGVTVTYFYILKRGATTIISSNTTSSNASVSLSRTSLTASSLHTIECYISRSGFTNSDSTIIGFSTFESTTVATSNPTIPSFSMSNCVSSNFSIFCTYSWQVRNNDALTAIVDSGPSSPPTYDSRSVNSNTTSATITQTSVESFNDGQTAFGSVFARATASGKTASTIIRADTSTSI